VKVNSGGSFGREKVKVRGEGEQRWEFWEREGEGER